MRVKAATKGAARLAYIDARPIVAGISGGKDSTAMGLLLREWDIPFRAVFMDTGWEDERTQTYLIDVLEPLFGPIDRIRSSKYPGGMPDLIRAKKAFAWRLVRFCTEELKFKPIQAYLEAVSDEEDCEPINAVGIRRAESQARSAALEWEWNPDLDCEVWRPLVRWSTQDVIDIHTRHGVRPNPLYLKGARRVGCFPCIFSRKAEIRLVADLAPDRIATIRQLEAELTVARGSPRTYFHGRAAARSAKGAPAPDIYIDEVVDWARTAHGGRQGLLFDVDEPGCVRWGLCDARDD